MHMRAYNLFLCVRISNIQCWNSTNPPSYVVLINVTFTLNALQNLHF